MQNVKYQFARIRVQTPLIVIILPIKDSKDQVFSPVCAQQKGGHLSTVIISVKGGELEISSPQISSFH